MQFETSDKGEFRILRIKEDLSVNSDISELKTIVSEHLANGYRNFAFAFTKNSFLYTKSIAILITCSEKIKEQGGKIAIIEANDDIIDLLNLIDFESVIKVYPTENDLLNVKTS